MAGGGGAWEPLPGSIPPALGVRLMSPPHPIPRPLPSPRHGSVLCHGAAELRWAPPPVAPYLFYTAYNPPPKPGAEYRTEEKRGPSSPCPLWGGAGGDSGVRAGPGCPRPCGIGDFPPPLRGGVVAAADGAGGRTTRTSGVKNKKTQKKKRNLYNSQIYSRGCRRRFAGIQQGPGRCPPALSASRCGAAVLGSAGSLRDRGGAAWPPSGVGVERCSCCSRFGAASASPAQPPASSSLEEPPAGF